MVAEDGAEARQIARRAIERYVQLNLTAQGLAQQRGLAEQVRSAMEDLTIDHLLDQGRVLAGSPAQVAAAIERARDLLGLAEDGERIFYDVND